MHPGPLLLRSGRPSGRRSGGNLTGVGALGSLVLSLAISSGADKGDRHEARIVEP